MDEATPKYLLIERIDPDVRSQDLPVYGSDETRSMRAIIVSLTATDAKINGGLTQRLVLTIQTDDGPITLDGTKLLAWARNGE